ncbi:hypothetical protein BJX61DRAFT_73079 [Aspergillus egyptiacus]|nr:hypothetical protein BJX61DRAFT_73079 [Aspergillus egyptiacus]
MASHQVAIAKASLAAGLLRPDPSSVSRDEITALHNNLDRALTHCSPANIQTCKSWLLRYVVPSPNRVSLLAKYLVALSGSFEENSNNTNAQSGTRTGSSVKRKRLHILYLLNDLFHHTKYHDSSTAAFSGVIASVQPHLVDILSYAASYDRQKHPKHHRRLAELLDIWQENGYFGPDYVDKLREVVTNSAVSGPVRKTDTPGAEESDRKATKDVPFVMPPTHGDPSTPYYDLPAGNLIPHIVPNSTVPLQPDMIKPLQFLAGPADEQLVTALKKFLKDVDRIYGLTEVEPKDDEIVDVDELGQTVVRDTLTGDILDGETYYGWSRSFCQQMKKRNARTQRSESRSQSPPKRRRYSDSSDGSRYRSSRSRTPPRGDRRDTRSRSRSRSWRDSAREKSYSPPPPPGPPGPPPHAQHQYQHHAHNPYAPPGPHPQSRQVQFPPQAFPPPPPPPPPAQANYPNYPPPFPHMPQQMPQQMPPGPYNLPPPGGRGWHPPPPPPGRGW